MLPRPSRCKRPSRRARSSSRAPRRHRHRRRCLLRDRTRRRARARRRIRLRQDRHRAGDARVRAAGKPDRPRQDPDRSVRRPRGVGRRAPAATGQPRLVCAPGSVDVAQSRSPHRRPDSRDAPRPPCDRSRHRQPGCSAARARPAAGRRGVPAPLPAPAFGRSAAARLHRNGARLRAEAGRARRADNGPRRHDAEANHRGHRRAPAGCGRRARSTSRTTSPLSPNSPTRSQSCTAGESSSSQPRETAFTAPSAPVHDQADPLDPRGGAPNPPRRDPRDGRGPRRTAAGLSLRAALRASDRSLCGSDAPSRPGGQRARGSLLPMARPLAGSSGIDDRCCLSRRGGRVAADRAGSRRDVRARTAGRGGGRRPRRELRLGRRECLAIVGESGSGKTTLARCLAGLHAPKSGAIEFDGQALAATARGRPLEIRRRIQLIFQNPDFSLNPRQTVREIIRRPFQQFFGDADALRTRSRSTSWSSSGFRLG